MKCPNCKIELKAKKDKGGTEFFKCKKCGYFKLTEKENRKTEQEIKNERLIASVLGKFNLLI